MGESRVLSGSGCHNASGEGSRLSTCTAESWGDGMAMVRGNISKGIVGCGDGGGVRNVRWLVMASSMISTAVSSIAVIVGEGVMDGSGEDIAEGDGDGDFFSCFCGSFIMLWALLRPLDVGDRSQ